MGIEVVDAVLIDGACNFRNIYPGSNPTEKDSVWPEPDFNQVDEMGSGCIVGEPEKLVGDH